MSTQILDQPAADVRPIKDEIQEMRDIVRDLFEIRGSVFWTDMVISAVAGWTCFALSIATNTLALKVLLLVLAAVLVYRAMVFTHEIVHLRRGELPGFRIAWHFLCGVPMLAPNFLYRQVHLTHHSKKHYGTSGDGEYVSFPKTPLIESLKFLLSGLFIPLASIIRFCVLSPAYWLHPKTRQFVEVYGSAMGIKVMIERAPPKNKKERLEWTCYELTCFALIVGTGCLIYQQVLPLNIVLSWYAMVCLVITMNAIRAIGCTHLYVHNNGEPVSLREQLEDSLNLNNDSLLTIALCPVGTRYHCLHHIFPSIPYHAAREAHLRLIESLPTESFYKKREIRSLWEGWKLVWPKKSSHLHEQVAAKSIN